MIVLIILIPTYPGLPFIITPLSKKKITTFVTQNRFDLSEIDESEVSGNQLNVLKAAKSKSPIINEKIIEKFYAQVRYPVYFLDYETYTSTIQLLKD